MNDFLVNIFICLFVVGVVIVLGGPGWAAFGFGALSYLVCRAIDGVLTLHHG